MKNLKWKKAGSAVLATALAGSMVLPATAYAQGEIVQLEGGTSTQTNTAPEQVFLNKYSGTVRTQNFNDNWKFYLGDASGAQTPAFDDSSFIFFTIYSVCPIAPYTSPACIPLIVSDASTDSGLRI